jgi:predicted metal-dependent hydrolase
MAFPPKTFANLPTTIPKGWKEVLFVHILQPAACSGRFIAAPEKRILPFRTSAFGLCAAASRFCRLDMLCHKAVRTMHIQYSLKRSRKRKKTISLQIGSHSEIIVYAPQDTPINEINRFVAEKQSWIDMMARKQASLQVLETERTYATGESFYYLGQAYPLESYFEPLENTGVILWRNRFFLNCPENTNMKKGAFIAWYKKRAKQYLSERVDFYEKMLKLKSGGLRITSAGKRWGSCSYHNHLSFSFRLIMAPPAVVDYVVVHELTHIREKNHSSKFWNLVVETFPDYKERQLWLREHHHIFYL